MSGLQTIWTPNKFVATDEATSTTTGSIIILGGESIGKNLFVGGNTNVNGNATVLGQISTGTQVINSTIDATNSLTGSLTLAGGMGISKSLYIGGNLNVTGAFSTGGLALTATTDSSSTSTGTLIVPGGVGIGKKLYVGDNTSINGQVSAQSEILSATINSTSTSTGTLTIYGGVGIYKNVYIGGDTTTNNLSILSTTASTDATTGSLLVSGGVGVLGGIQVAGTSAFTGTVTALTQTYPDNSTKIATDAYVISALNTVNSASANPTGFENQTSSTLSYSASTRVFSISPVSGSYNVWISGVRYTYSSTINMPAHPTTSGVTYYYYFTAAGLQRGTSYPNFTTAAMCSIVYYYNSSLGLMTEERHGCVMDPATHLVLHEQIGTYYVSGLVASGYNISPAVPTDLDNRFTTTAGVISDEGLNTNILEVAIGGPYNCTQLTGANGIWFWIPSTVPYHYSTNGYIQYNQYTGSTWQLTQLGSDTWVNYYVCFIPEYSGSTQILTLPGQTTYTSATQARAESFYSLTLLSLPFPEILPMYQITFGTSSTYTSAGKCRIDAFTRIYGSKATILNNEAFNHEALNGLQLASSGVTWGHINDQTQSIYGIKTLANTSNATSISTGSLIVGGGSSVLKDFYVGGSIESTNTQTSTSITTGALQIAGGAGINQLYVATTTTLNGNMNMGTNNISSVGNVTSTGIISTTNTTLSTSTNSGAVQITGGIGAAQIFVANNTTSTSTTTGALQIAGGAGINQLYVATTTTLNGNMNMGTNNISTVGNVTSTGIISTTNTTLSTSTNSGAVQIAGGIGTNQLYVATTTTMNGNLYLGTNNISTVNDITSSGIISTSVTSLSTSTTTGAVRIAGGLGVSEIFVANTTTSTSTTTGSLMVAGGIGTNQLYVATTSTMNGNLALGTNDITSVRNITATGTFNINTLQLTNTSLSTSTNSGALQVAGGIGAAEIFIANNTQSTSTTTGSLLVAGGAGINQLYVATTTTMGGNLSLGTNNISTVGNVTSTGIISTTNTTLSTSTTTGAVRIAGGLGVSEIFVANTTTSTSTTTGSLMVAGGAGINQLYVATTSTMGGNLALGTNDITSVRNITASGTFNVVSLQLTGTTQSTSITTGSLIVPGGAGITGDVFVGGMVYSASNTAMNAPNGFENQTDSTVSYNPTTRVLTISPTSTSFNVWVNGKRFTYTTPQIATAHTASINMYHYYFDPSGVLQWSVSFPSLYASASAFFVYYYSTTIYFVQEERHAPIMDPMTHLELHTQIGTYYVSGLALSYTLNGATNASNQWSSAAGAISDEGLQLTGGISANTTPNYNLMYLDSTQNWTWSSGNTMPYSYTVGGNINYNQNTSGTTWALNPIPVSSFVNTYILYVPSLSASTQVFSVIGQAYYTSLALAQGESFSNLAITNLALPEYLVLYQLNWRCNNYAPLGNCRLAGVVRIVDNRSAILNNVATNHQALSGLQLASSGVTYGHIDDQSQSIFGIKTFANTSAATSGTTGSLIVSGGIGANQLYVTTTTNIDGNLTTGTSSIVRINNTTLSSSITTGALQIAGGIGTSEIFIANTTTSTSTTTGSLLVAGGAGINQLYVATTTTMNGNLALGTNDITSVRNITSSGTFSTVILQLTGTTQSTSTSTGTLIIGGGTGIAKDLYVGGIIESLTTNTSTSITTGALQIAGGAGINQLYVATTTTMGGNLSLGTNNISTVGGVTASGIISTTNTTLATSTNSGALQIAGGIGAAEIFIANTTTSSSTTTGSLLVAGGAGINQLYVATTSTMGGNLSLGTNNISTVGNVTSTGIISTTNTTLATSTNSGAVQVAGGLGVGQIYIAQTTNATSTTTGSLIVSGGTSIAGNLYVGGTVVYSGSNNSATTQSTSTSTGALIIAGGTGIAKNLYVGGGIVSSGIYTGISTVNSTSTTTGSLILNGGASIAGNLYVGGNVVYSGSNNSSTVDSTSTSTGSLILSGGIGVAKQAHIGDTLTIHNITTGANSCSLNVNTSGALTINSSGNICNFDVTDQVNINATTNTTLTSVGALVIAGGAGIAKNLYVGGNLNVAGSVSYATLTISGTTLSTSTSTGALIIAGGVGIAKSCYAANHWSANIGTPATQTNLMYQAFDTQNSYIQNNIQNLSNGTAASSDYIATSDTGTDSVGYIDMGINGSGFTGTYGGVNDGYLFVKGGATGGRGNLYIGTVTDTMSTYFTNGSGNTNVMSITSAGVNVLLTIDSTNTTTGSLVSSGGMGIAKQLHTGDSINIHNVTDTTKFGVLTVNTLGALTINASGNICNFDVTDQVVVNATTDTTLTNAGSFVVAGGVGIAKNLYIGGNLNVGGSILYTTLGISGTTQSTNTLTGALTVAGGVGIGKNLNVGGTLNVAGSIQCTTLAVTATTQATSTSTGSVVVGGGIGIRKACYAQNYCAAGKVGGTFSEYAGTIFNGIDSSTDWIQINIQNTGSSTNSTTDIVATCDVGSDTTGYINFGINSSGHYGGAGGVCDGYLFVKGDTGYGGGNMYVGTITNSKKTYFFNGSSYTTIMTIGANASVVVTTQSSGTSTGALLVAGGVGIAKNVNIGGTLTKGGGSFLIPHPDPSKPDWQLRHCFVETNTRGDNIYRFTVTTTNNTATITLPSYYKFLNENTQIFVSPADNFGAGYGVIDDTNQNVTITTNLDGKYNVLVIGTRTDALMKEYWDTDGAEIPPPTTS